MRELGQKISTDTRILQAAATIVRDEGPDRLTFDHVAERVGISKQAVLYWFPNKGRLIEALVRPSLELEAICGEEAVRPARRESTAIRAFVEAVAAFHVADLDRFRLMYVTPQVARPASGAGEMLTTLGRIHPATTRMHDALADKLMRYGSFEKLTHARRAAGAIHTAVIGTVLRMAMADTLRAPLRHRDDAVISALVGVLSPRTEAP